MQLPDHIFVVLLFLVQPVVGLIQFRRVVREIEAGEVPDRVKFYGQTVVIQWLGLAALAAIWIVYDRSVASLGFREPGGAGFWIGAVLLIVACGFCYNAWQSAKSLGDDDKLEQRRSFGHLAYFLPQTRRELRAFNGVSITAGVVEETIYRGFVFWYLLHFMPLWATVIVSSVFFGLAHGYQGAGGALRIGLVGLAFGGLYILTGSIWLPILGHVLLDVLQGATVYEVLRDHISHSGKPPSSSGSTIDTSPEYSGASGGSDSPSSGSA